jgi:signal transduction histidine kinase
MKILPTFIRKSVYLKLLGTFLIVSIIPLSLIGIYVQYSIEAERSAVSKGMQNLANQVGEHIKEEGQNQFTSTERLIEKTEDTLLGINEATSEHIKIYEALYEEGLIDNETYLKIQEDHYRFRGAIDEMNYSIRQNSREVDEGFSLTSDLIISNINKHISNEEKELENLMLQTRNLFTFSLFAGLLTAIIFSAYISKRTVGPVHKLQGGFNEIRKGNLDVSLETDAIDESGTLIMDFNQTVSQLKTSQLQNIESNLALKEAYEELKSLDELKTNLVANVSHELRTPITIVSSAMELAKEIEDKDERDEILEMARDAIAKQDLIVDDLMEAARIGESPKVLNEVNLADILDDVCGEFKPLTKKQEIKLDRRYEKILPVVRVDTKQLKHVIRNLISNAIKFNKKGGKVSIDAKQRGDFLEVSVMDGGIGIPADKISKIFDRFYQADSSTTRDYGGTGLGLAVAKDITEAHGGEIGVESEPKKWTRFYFTLPISKRK